MHGVGKFKQAVSRGSGKIVSFVSKIYIFILTVTIYFSSKYPKPDLEPCTDVFFCNKRRIL